MARIAAMQHGVWWGGREALTYGLVADTETGVSRPIS